MPAHFEKRNLTDIFKDLVLNLNGLILYIYHHMKNTVGVKH